MAKVTEIRGHFLKDSAGSLRGENPNTESSLHLAESPPGSSELDGSADSWMTHRSH